MILPDVNVLIYAYREDSVEHSRYKEWLDNLLKGDGAYGISELVLSSFLRVVTHPKIFRTPTPLEKALMFIEELKNQPHCIPVSPGQRHWEIFQKFCRQAHVKGNLVADAYLAALAMESGCQWITTDRDFSRFPGLHWRHPLD